MRKVVVIGGWIVAAVLVVLYIESKYQLSVAKKGAAPTVQGSSASGVSPGLQSGHVVPSSPPELSSEQLYKLAGPAVALIEVFDAQGQKFALGSGFVVSTAGIVVTNYHVIRGAYRAIAHFQDGASYPVAGVVGYDPARDVAVLDLGTTLNSALQLGDSDNLRAGERVIAIGSPLGLENTISEGIVSGLRNGVIQMTASISHGSSGGPVLDSSGKVVGIAVATVAQGQNINFAVPIGWVKPYVGQHSSSTLDQIARQNEVTQYVLQSTVSVPAHQARISRIVVNPNLMADVELGGDFRSSGGFGSNVEVLVVHNGTKLYDSGRVTEGHIQVPLREPGEYQFVIDNRGSLMFARNVTGNVSLRYVK